MNKFCWSVVCVALLVGCSVYDPTLVAHDPADAMHVDPPDAGSDAHDNLDAHDMLDAQDTPDAQQVDDAGPDATMADECVPTDQEFCPLLCPETCNGEDDDCDGRIDENNIEQSVCDLHNAEAICDEGACAITRCINGGSDCDHIADNGCEASLAEPENCGLCGNACTFNHASATCDDGQCGLGDCEDGYGNCDGLDDNGCELRLDTTDHCGGCDTSCGVINNGSSGCVDSACAVTDCDSGYDDCNGEVDDGCEIRLDNVSHCGACDLVCSFDTAGALCSAMTCVPDGCGIGLGDCDGQPDNGCEVSLDTDNANCGVCGGACQAGLLGNTQAATCLDGECTATTCTTGYGDCDDQASNGCEASLRTLSHCGDCATTCAIANAVASCNSGTCTFTRCLDGFGNCDGNLNNGCEARLDTLSNCGMCNQACNVMSGTPSCAGGICGAAGCNPGLADCDGDGISCETDLRTDEAHCGSCSSTCGPLAHATAECTASACRIQSCDAGYGDCDGNVQNGCETPLNTTTHCGMCGRGCSYSRAGATCNAGTCAIGACNPGWASCDGNNNNGCETQLNTLTSCNACNDTCDLPNAVEACSSGSCIVVTCDSNDLGNCDSNATNGCEQSLNSLNHCGACNTPCALDHASESCVARTCQLDACDAGYANCDNVRANGCERSTRTTTDCGGCGTVCDLAHGQESCASGTCTLTGCESGFGNCDMQPGNGCEQALNTNTHCGGCNIACTPDHASGTCSTGQCAITACSSGFADCDGLASTGCERALSGGATCSPLIGRVGLGDNHSCAVRGDGRVACWGLNGESRLGEGTTNERWAPTHVSNLNDATLVTGGASHTCALRASGQVMCWGYNADGRLGDGSSTIRTTPVNVTNVSDATSISAGDNFTCAVRRNGTAVCWGNNVNGRLGDGSTTTRTTAVNVSGITDAVQISAGTAHACAVVAGGQVMCWGYNGSGRLGDNSTTERRTPVTVSGITNAVQVSAGYDHTCAVLTTGAVQCWGDGSNGRLGNNATGDQNTPVSAIGINDAVQVSTGLNFTCAVRSTGQVMCWGYNIYGKLGDDTITERRVPTATLNLTDAIEVSCGDNHVCAMRAGGQVSCWGYNGSGRLGEGSSTDRRVPTGVSGFGDGAQISVGGYHACGLRAGGEVQCWGYGGRLGDGTTIVHRGSVPVTGFSDAIQIDAGFVHACAVRNNQQVWCWGDNGSGQLGDNTTANRTAPVRAGSIANAVQVSTDGVSTCAVTDNHYLYCWGSNANGRLGTGNAISVSAPALLLGITDAEEVSLGYEHACYRRQNGTIGCAGNGGYGRLGNGATTDQWSFVNVSGISNATQVNAGYYHTCALRSGGGISCWGRNDLGQLGDGSNTNRTTPVAVSGITDAIKIAGGELFTCALRQTGQVMCWGFNTNGRLGDSTTTNRNTPVNVIGVTDAIDIAAGYTSACALRDNGETVCWGDNAYGRLSDGTLLDRSTFVPMVALP